MIHERGSPWREWPVILTHVLILLGYEGPNFHGPTFDRLAVEMVLNIKSDGFTLPVKISQ